MVKILQLIAKKYFTLDYVDYLPEAVFDRWIVLVHPLRKADIEYEENSPDPKLFTFDSKKMEWTGEPIMKK